MAGEFLTLRRYAARHMTTDGQQGERGDPMNALALIAVLALVFLWLPLATAAPPSTTVHVLPATPALSPML